MGVQDEITYYKYSLDSCHLFQRISVSRLQNLVNCWTWKNHFYSRFTCFSLCPKTACYDLHSPSNFPRTPLLQQLWIGALGDQLLMCLNLELISFGFHLQPTPTCLGKKAMLLLLLLFLCCSRVTLIFLHCRQLMGEVCYRHSVSARDKDIDLHDVLIS